MEQRKVTFKWIKLYKAKLKEREEARQKSIDRLKKRYQEEDARKRTRQIQLCSKVSPSSKKRSYWGELVQHLCEKAVIHQEIVEFLPGHPSNASYAAFVVKNLAAMKRSKAVIKNHSVLSKPKSVTASSLPSWNKTIEPFRRRF
ncbi:uncharacterized protein LOC121784211 [Salvia splendens]|uniref:uncharacterized protein LOC121784211 n=1 Tax=Salvia splendens TaxID=180675 RepID=UPI001C272FFB|nr:uncharacterized protein LOC121784211 [Salvia splendens]